MRFRNIVISSIIINLLVPSVSYGSCGAGFTCKEFKKVGGNIPIAPLAGGAAGLGALGAAAAASGGGSSDNGNEGVSESPGAVSGGDVPSTGNPGLVSPPSDGGSDGVTCSGTDVLGEAGKCREIPFPGADYALGAFATLYIVNKVRKNKKKREKLE